MKTSRLLVKKSDCYQKKKKENDEKKEQIEIEPNKEMAMSMLIILIIGSITVSAPYFFGSERFPCKFKREQN